MADPFQRRLSPLVLNGIHGILVTSRIPG